MQDRQQFEAVHSKHGDIHYKQVISIQQVQLIQDVHSLEDMQLTQGDQQTKQQQYKYFDTLCYYQNIHFNIHKHLMRYQKLIRKHKYYMNFEYHNPNIRLDKIKYRLHLLLFILQDINRLVSLNLDIHKINNLLKQVHRCNKVIDILKYIIYYITLTSLFCLQITNLTFTLIKLIHNLINIITTHTICRFYRTFITIRIACLTNSIWILILSYCASTIIIISGRIKNQLFLRFL
ncbi:unnamed protein product [Paramecium sonneborni]|uniref:Transmembrane protein n=1 Tax=Paramecium sonneborni TaxID=65129 RepID=A0A8S1MFL9_9CILI|nr:unnamed protein product [Paramecium sonneborni]